MSNVRCLPLIVILFLTRSAFSVEPARTEVAPLDYRIELTTALKGFDGNTCWVHARSGVIPSGAPGNVGTLPICVTTMQKLVVTKSDVFYGLCDLRSDDFGKTWIGPTSQPGLDRRSPQAGVEVVPCDFTPAWHAASGKLLGTGTTFWYSSEANDHLQNSPSEISYSAYDVASRSWQPWKTMDLPKDPKFQIARAGCTQRVDLANGDILLPIYFRKIGSNQRTSTICRCRFDGETLTYLQHGDELAIDDPRGFYEPSLTSFQGRFYLTLRNDVRSYATVSNDGLHFEPVRPWTFDDGSELGSYNTQQHWVTHSDGLFLVYTRRGANNDHVSRHRAPLFMARVDPERLVIVRETERIIVPERGAALGNFGVANINPNETWITVSEWMQPKNAAERGSDNSVFVAKLHWNRPSRSVGQ